ncbi:MAG: c-type cytochrome [Polyangia bacterium]|jgi:mono/diheme cytochrome c family protein
MSDEQNPPSNWGSEAKRLANRFALGSGVVVTFVLFGLIVIPAFLRERRPLARPPSDQPAAASVGWLDQAEAPASKGRDLPPLDPATVMTPNAKLLGRGEVLFKQNCSSCHGESGQGNGPAAGTLNPRPRNFTQPAGWEHGFRMTDIFTTITTGIKGTGMAAFDFIMPADRMALVHTVRSLGGFDHGAEDPKALEALANQFRSKGFHIPNRIPVSLAMRKMVQEQTRVAPLQWPPAEDKSTAAELLRFAIADPSRVARTVAVTANRNDPAAVARAWAAGAPDNGFAPAAAGLNIAEWGEIVRALVGTKEQARQP